MTRPPRPWSPTSPSLARPPPTRVWISRSIPRPTTSISAAAPRANSPAKPRSVLKTRSSPSSTPPAPSPGAHQFGGSFNHAANGIVFDADGTSVLTRLGLNSDKIVADEAETVTALSTARADQYLYVAIDDQPKQKITLDVDDSFSFYCRKSTPSWVSTARRHSPTNSVSGASKSRRLTAPKSSCSKAATNSTFSRRSA